MLGSSSWSFRVYTPLHFRTVFSDIWNMAESCISDGYENTNRRARRRNLGLASLSMRHSSSVVIWRSTHIFSQLLGRAPKCALKRSMFAFSLYLRQCLYPTNSSPRAMNSLALTQTAMVLGVWWAKENVQAKFCCVIALPTRIWPLLHIQWPCAGKMQSPFCPLLFLSRSQLAHGRCYTYIDSKLGTF